MIFNSNNAYNSFIIIFPLTQRADFVNLSAQGNLAAIETNLLKGQDIESTDFTGCTAIHVAATNQHAELVDYLYRAGAELECRDKNVSHIINEAGSYA